MAENSVDISVSVPSSGHSINVFVPGSTGEVTARDNLAQTYAEWARLWAIKIGDKVNGDDYSSKYYAQQARYSSESAKLSENSCEAYIIMLQNNYNIYSEAIEHLYNEFTLEVESSLQSAKDWATKTNGTVDGEDYSSKHYAMISQDKAEECKNVVVEVEGVKTTILQELADGVNSALSEVESATQEAITTVETTSTNAVNTVQSAGNTVINKIMNLGITGLEVSFREEDKTLVFSDLNYEAIANALDSVNGEVI
ncbi:MAG: hypothetical protein NC408_04525 [Candidatus Gastranaerophilales bacterium]|nr:hypothetical protein [Candidatus Gastranaerophilales bacterium]MCM1072263.1 hypothetical protein [Bacteroides sp.]